MIPVTWTAICKALPVNCGCTKQECNTTNFLVANLCFCYRTINTQTVVSTERFPQRDLPSVAQLRPIPKHNLTESNPKAIELWNVFRQILCAQQHWDWTLGALSGDAKQVWPSLEFHFRVITIRSKNNVQHYLGRKATTDLCKQLLNINDFLLLNQGISVGENAHGMHACNEATFFKRPGISYRKYPRSSAPAHRTHLSFWL